jgi:peroxiredoxin
LELEALQQSIDQFRNMGADLLAVSPQAEVYSQELIQEKKFSFALLSDPGNQVAKKFGLVYNLPQDLKEIYQKFGIDLEKYNGDDSWTLPVPARYIIDTTGGIRYRESDADYTIRPEPEDTIQALRAL